MLGATSRHESVKNFATAVLVVVALGSLGACGYGAYEWVASGQRALGVSFICVGVAGLLVSVLLYCQIVLVLKYVNYAYRVYDVLLEASELLRRQEEHSRMIAENSGLSEWAKRIVYREKDYEFLRDTIHSAIVRQDWEAAEHLIRDLETHFGYRDEAARMREDLEQARRATAEERIAAALKRFESLCDQRKWDQARSECERLGTLFPGYKAIADLPRELERRRQEVKQQLLKEYEQAVRNQDVDRAHSLLFALDRYLIPSEAEPLKESARSVFRARLEQLKARFTIAVAHKEYASAVEAGEHLLREFPNSGYAQEIAKMLPMMRQRAGQSLSAAGRGSSCEA